MLILIWGHRESFLRRLSRRRLDGFSHPMPVSPRPPPPPPTPAPAPLLPALDRDVTLRDGLQLFCLISKNVFKNTPFHHSHALKSITCYIHLYDAFLHPASRRFTLLRKRRFAGETLRTVPCAGPPIVLAASPGLGAETMPPDVKHDDEHAVTTTTAVHARPKITLTPTQSKKCDRGKRR